MQPATKQTASGQLITDSTDPRNSEDHSYQKYMRDKIAKVLLGDELTKGASLIEDDKPKQSVSLAGSRKRRAAKPRLWKP